MHDLDGFAGGPDQCFLHGPAAASPVPPSPAADGDGPLLDVYSQAVAGTVARTASAVAYLVVECQQQAAPCAAGWAG
jgi:hypothetical protein